MSVSYVLPLKWHDTLGLDEMAHYLEYLSQRAEVVVVDGSPADIYEQHGESWGKFCRHLRPHDDLQFANGKVNGVLTGFREAVGEHVVIADDDVRYNDENLKQMDKLLSIGELVVPQNYFHPAPWHANWDTARILLNRAFWHDYPGTLGVRRSFILGLGGYNGDVLFENLELIRTVRAGGGTILHVPDLFVRRLPPPTGKFWGQRARQAYDDLAQPWRLAAFLPLLPLAGWAARSKPSLIAGAAGAAVALAEVGRRRDSGRDVFGPRAPLFAPLWVVERAICIWGAVGQRLLGGCRYGDTTIRRAATPPRELVGRFAVRKGAPGLAAKSNGLV